MTESLIEPKISAYHFLAHGFGDHRLLQQIRFIDQTLCLVRADEAQTCTTIYDKAS